MCVCVGKAKRRHNRTSALVMGLQLAGDVVIVVAVVVVVVVVVFVAVLFVVVFVAACGKRSALYID